MTEQSSATAHSSTHRVRAWFTQLPGRVLIPVVFSVFASMLGASLYERFLSHEETSIDVVMLIPRGDAQGSQFALGVVRAREWATQLGQDRFGRRTVALTVLDEERALRGRGALDSLVHEIVALRPAAVIGPLRSSSALRLVPPLVEKRIPILMGIPTRTDLTHDTNGLVWRLSPNDDKQAGAIAALCARLHNSRNAVVLWDGEVNPAYGEALAGSITKDLTQLNNSGVKCIRLVDATMGSELANLGRGETRVIAFAGMPVAAMRAMETLRQRHDAMWILSDGCIDKDFLAALRLEQELDSRRRVFLTFQAPSMRYASGLKTYCDRMKMVGQEVGAAVDPGKCSPEAGAVSYEVFGYDTYMILGELLRRTGGSRSAAAVAKAMHNGLVTTPTLLMGPYEFVGGENTRLGFHVYEIRHGCLEHADSLCMADKSAQ